MCSSRGTVDEGLLSQDLWCQGRIATRTTDQRSPEVYVCRALKSTIAYRSYRRQMMRKVRIDDAVPVSSSWARCHRRDVMLENEKIQERIDAGETT